MIETSLVHIRSLSEPEQFIGCGALVEGGYVATCRHVWRDAGGPEADNGAVLVVFPRSFGEDGAPVAHVAVLADPCEDPDCGKPDLVLLRVDRTPSDVMPLQIARAERFECCRGFEWAFLPSRRTDVKIRGEIDDAVTTKGWRSFNYDGSNKYWFEHGSSGSPVFIDGGQQLAGLVTHSDFGEEGQSRELREAFVVPGLTIWCCVGHAQARSVVERAAHVDPALLRDLLMRLGHENVPASEIPARLEAAFAEMRARAETPVPHSNEGGDIDATIKAARARLADLDQPAALAIIKAKRAEARKDAIAREVRLLQEQAAIERLAFDHEAAKRSLQEAARLDPDAVWVFIALGDVWEALGDVREAETAYRAAAAAAERLGAERDLAASCSWLGDALVAQGALGEALDVFRKSLAIRERLAAADPSHAERQRDLSVSFENIGNVLFAQGALAEALQYYRKDLAISERLAAVDPSHAERQRDLSASYAKIGAVHAKANERDQALDALTKGRAIIAPLVERYPDWAQWRRDLARFDARIADLRAVEAD